MMTTTSQPTTRPRTMPVGPPPDRNPWLLWRPETPSDSQRLTIAELAECRCPELCDRDHDNE